MRVVTCKPINILKLSFITVLTNNRCRICTKYIDVAMERLKTKTVQDEKDLSLVERILASEPDPKTAYILALDLILVGIDTVNFILKFYLVYFV